MSKRDERLLLLEMSEAVKKIILYTTGLDFTSYLEDSKTQDAVLRNLTVLGEAANQLSDQFCSAHPAIEWEKIIRSRHILVHDYFDIDHEIIWRIVTDYLIPLQTELEAILEK